MNKDFTGVNPQIYGQTDFVPTPGVAVTAAPGASIPPVKVPLGEVLKNDPKVPHALAIRAAENVDPATIQESMKAAISQWVPSQMWENYNDPIKDVPEEGHDPVAGIALLGFTPTPEQRAVLLNTKGGAGFHRAVDRMEAQAKAYRVMGDHPVASFIGQAVDPFYLGLDIFGMGAGRLAQAAKIGTAMRRTAVGASVAAGTYMGESSARQYAPISEAQMWVGALMNGAISGALVRGNKPATVGGHPVPELPVDRLRALAREAEQGHVERAEAPLIKAEGGAVFKRVEPSPIPAVTQAVPMEAGVVRATTPEPRVPVTVASGERVGIEPTVPFKAYSARGLLLDMGKNADPLVSKLATRLAEILPQDVMVRAVAKKNLPKGRPYYDPQTHAVYLNDATPQNIQLHEIAHAATVHKIQYGTVNPNTAHGNIVRDLRQLHEEARAGAAGASTDPVVKHYMSNLDEFVAGVYSGKSAFTDMLANTKTLVGTGSVLSAFVQGIRKMLGMGVKDSNVLLKAIGLTDDLVGTALNVTLKNTLDTTGGMSIRLAPPQIAGMTSRTTANATLASKVAHFVDISLASSLGKFNATTNRIKSILVDDVFDMAGNSVASQQRAIHADLVAHAYRFDDAIKVALAERGVGMIKGTLDMTRSLQVKQGLEREVGVELLRRDRLSMDGIAITHTGVSPQVKGIADIWDEGMAAALAEQKRSGVFGSDLVKQKSGYFTRKYDQSKIESITQRLMVNGATEAEAQATIRDAFSIGLQRANGWDAALSNDVAGSILRRTRDKGYFDDVVFKQAGTEDGMGALRAMLLADGYDAARAERVVQAMGGTVDEAGKMSQLKHRVDIAMDEAINLPDGSVVTLADTLDMNLTNIMDQYMTRSAAESAFARKGLTKSSDVAALRREFIGSVTNDIERKEAAKLFDDTLDVLYGNPVGERVPDMMRNVQALNQMSALGASGMWQVVESMTTLYHYGAIRGATAMFSELPVIRTILGSPDEAAHLQNVLIRNTSQDIRIRPFVNRMEDNFEVPLNKRMTLLLQQAKQYTPYINGMKAIQKWQARSVSNLVVNTFERAAKGDVKAIEALGKYGLESHIVDRIRADIAMHGMDTAKWSKSTWDDVRGPLTKMMDDSVIRARLGEIPAYAQFTATGKFIFTFRAFQLASHSKVLAKTLDQDGFAGLGLLFAYQAPMAVLMTAAANAVQGKKEMSIEDLVKKGLGQTSVFGLFSDILGYASGSKMQFGSPGLLYADRVAKLIGATTGAIAGSNGAGSVGSALIQMTPLLSLVGPVKGYAESIKDYQGPVEKDWLRESMGTKQ